MGFETALFLSIGSISMMTFLICLIYFSHRQKTKQLEIEALKIREANVQHEVEQEVSRQMKELLGRIEVLEAIVTDKQYELNEKISRLK